MQDRSWRSYPSRHVCEHAFQTLVLFRSGDTCIFERFAAIAIAAQYSPVAWLVRVASDMVNFIGWSLPAELACVVVAFENLSALSR
jgi:hypothetical protein